MEEKPVNPDLAANMKRLLAGRGIGLMRKLMGEAGVHVGQGMLHNALHGKTGNVRSLEKIARYFNVTVEQLLQPGLGDDMPVWPFSLELYQRVTKLNEQELQRLETAMRVHLGMDVQMDVINSTLARYRASVAEALRAAFRMSLKLSDDS
jgi:transcriptional regulator with XRE-family HTH domain